jgi:hypothetical protein
MKKGGSIVLAAIMVLGFLGNAGAFSILESDIYSPDTWMSYTEGAQGQDFTLSMVDYAPGAGYAITSAILSLTFVDDGGPFDLEEFATLTYGGKTAFYEVETGTTVIPISLDGINTLNAGGELTFSLQRYFGDFTFTSAKLTAEATPVPIPGSLWLMGPALLGFLAMKRTFVRAGA